MRKKTRRTSYSYFLSNVKPHDLYGRSLIVHADKDDLGRGAHEDSGTTGHSGARIACAIFGRAS
jgi:Cu-Zn family superoxide dismutase